MIIALTAVIVAPGHAGPALALVPIGAGAETGRVFELRVDGVPDGGNPYDPDAVRVDCTVTPKGGAPFTVPAFRYQGFERKLEGKKELCRRKGARNGACGSRRRRRRHTP